MYCKIFVLGNPITCIFFPWKYHFMGHTFCSYWCFMLTTFYGEVVVEHLVMCLLLYNSAMRMLALINHKYRTDDGTEMSRKIWKNLQFQTFSLL